MLATILFSIKRFIFISVVSLFKMFFFLLNNLWINVILFFVISDFNFPKLFFCYLNFCKFLKQSYFIIKADIILKIFNF